MKVLSLAIVGLLAAAALGAVAPQQPSTPSTATAERVVDLMAAQDFDKTIDLFDAAMKTALPADKLRAAWSGVVAQAGAFKARVRTSSQPRGTLLVTRVTCHFERVDVDVQIVIDASGLVGGLAFLPAAAAWTPPAYAPAGSYTESDVTVGAAGWPLPGTLTMPSGAGPFPAIVFVHGSGPEDRDETFGPNKTFKDLALGLAAQGIASVRYEKRTQQYAGKLAGIAHFTVKEESIDDATAAVAVLGRTPHIDPHRIIVLGHSLGGTLVPRIGASDPSIAGLISLAGATRKIEDAMLAQVTYLTNAAGPITPEGQKLVDDTKTLIAMVRALTPADEDKPGSIGGAPASYWLDLEHYDPIAVARTIAQPMLILQGERDYQVTLEDFAGWQRGLAGRPHVTYHTYPGLNHLFLPGSGPSLPAEYNVSGHVPDAVVRDIAAWVATIGPGR